MQFLWPNLGRRYFAAPHEPAPQAQVAMVERQAPAAAAVRGGPLEPLQQVRGPSRTRTSCCALVGAVARAAVIAPFSLVHQFLAQGVGSAARAIVQTGLVGLAGHSLGGVPLGYVAAGCLAGSVTALGIMAAAPTTVRLASGTLSALARRTEPLGPAALRKAEAVADALLLAVALLPGTMIAMRRTPDAPNLALFLLIVQAGRTTQNLVRDTFTHATRRALPRLEYRVRAGQGTADGRVRENDIIEPGTQGFQHVIVTRRAIAARLVGTMGSYAAIIYAVNAHLKPALKDRFGIGDAALGDGSPMADYLTVYLFEGFMSSLIEGFDGYTTTMSLAIAAWCGGARVELAAPEGFSRMTWARLQEDVRDNSFIRISNAVLTVEAERGFSRLRGLDGGSSEALGLQTLALTLTHFRGFTVEQGRHFHRLAEARQAQASIVEADFIRADFADEVGEPQDGALDDAGLGVVPGLPDAANHNPGQG